MIKSFQNVGFLIGILPAGILSDRIGRLKIVSLSSSLMVVSFGLLYAYPVSSIFFISEFLYGVALSMNSGALLAYYSSAKKKFGIKGDTSVFGHQVAIMNFMTLLGGNLGAAMFGVSIKMPIGISIIGFLVYPIFILCWIKFFNLENSDSVVKVSPFLFPAKRIWQNKKFRLLVVINVLFECGIQLILIYWPIIFVENFNYNLSMIYTLFIIVNLMGSELFSKVSSKISLGKFLPILSLCSVAAYIVMSFTKSSAYALVGFLIVEFIMGLMDVQIVQFSEQLIAEYENKSQVLSYVTFLTELAVISSLVLNTILGSLLHLSVEKLLLISAMYFFFLFLFSFLITKKEALTDVY